MSDVTFIDPQVAFKEAIAAGELCECDVHDYCEFWAGDFMYMHTGPNGDAKKYDWFKNRNTRRYLLIEWL